MLSTLLINILGWVGVVTYLIGYAPYFKTYDTTGLNATWVCIGILTRGRKWLIRN